MAGHTVNALASSLAMFLLLARILERGAYNSIKSGLLIFL